MKNMKKLAAFAGGIGGALFASPFAVMAATEEASLGEKMVRGLLNTVMGICIVFLVLLLIAWIISLFKYINKFAASREAKNAPAPAPAPAVVEPEPEEDSAGLSDDLELVAVITAAIHAYEQAQGNDIPADALVVRSIRKVGKAKWQNA